MAQTPQYTEAHSRRDQRLPADQHEVRVKPDGTYKCRACYFVGILPEATEHVARNQFEVN